MDKLQFTINETLITYRQSLCLRIIYNHMYTIATINLNVLFGAVIYILMHAKKLILVSYCGYKINVSKKEKYALQANNRYHLH